MKVYGSEIVSSDVWIMARKSAAEKPEHAARHCLSDIPYRMVVFHRLNGDIPLYLVAGSDADAMGAKKALRLAHALHGGSCFYCKEKILVDQVTVDHAQPLSNSGSTTFRTW